MENNRTENQVRFKVKTTEEDYSLELSEYSKMLDTWKGNKLGRDYTINSIDKCNFEVIATE